MWENSNIEFNALLVVALFYGPLSCYKYGMEKFGHLVIQINAIFKVYAGALVLQINVRNVIIHY